MLGLFDYFKKLFKKEDKDTITNFGNPRPEHELIYVNWYRDCFNHPDNDSVKCTITLKHIINPSYEIRRKSWTSKADTTYFREHELYQMHVAEPETIKSKEPINPWVVLNRIYGDLWYKIVGDDDLPENTKLSVLTELNDEFKYQIKTSWHTPEDRFYFNSPEDILGGKDV